MADDFDSIYAQMKGMAAPQTQSPAVSKSQSGTPVANQSKSTMPDQSYWDSLKDVPTQQSPVSNQQSQHQPGVLQTAWEGVKGFGSAFNPFGGGEAQQQQDPGFIKDVLNSNPISTAVGIAKSAWNASKPYSNQVIPSIQQAAKSKNTDDIITAAKNVVGSLPVVGPMIAGMGDELGNALGSGDPLAISHALGKTVGTAIAIGAPETVGEVAGKGLGAVGKGIKAVAPDSLGDLVNKVQDKLPSNFGGSIDTEADRARAWTAGLKPGVNIPTWQKSVKIAPDLIKDAESDFGRPIESVHDLLPQVDHLGNVQGPGAIGIAKNKLYETRNQLLQKAGSQGAFVDGNAIADAKIKAIDTFERVNDPVGVQNQIDKINQTYRRQFSLPEAEAMKEGAQARNNAFFAKSQPGQSSLLKGDPNVAGLTAEGDAWKKGIQNAVDSSVVAPEDVGALKQINQQLGSLTDFEKAAWQRKNVLDRQAVNSLPQTLTKLEAAGQMGKSLLNFKFGDAAAALGKATFADHLAEAMGTNGMIRRAVASHDLTGFSPIGISEGPSVEPYTSRFAKQTQALRSAVDSEVGPQGQAVKTPSQLGQGPTTPYSPAQPPRNLGAQPVPTTPAGAPNVQPVPGATAANIRSRSIPARNPLTESIDPTTPEGQAYLNEQRRRRGIQGIGR